MLCATLCGHLPGAGAGYKFCSQAWGLAWDFPPLPAALASPPTQTLGRTQSRRQMRGVSQALPSSFSEKETEGLLMKPQARHLKFHVGPREPSGGNAGPAPSWGTAGKARLVFVAASVKRKEEEPAWDAESQC